MKLQKILTLFFLLYQLSCHATIYWPLQENNNLSDKKAVLIFDVDQVLLDRKYNAPLIFFSHALDAIEPTKFLEVFPSIINVDPDKKHIPVEIMKACDLFNKSFNKEISRLDLDPAVDNLVAKHPVLQEATKSTISFAESMKHYCSNGIPRQESIDFLLRLHKAEYPIAIGTNQGYNTYKRLMNAQTVPDENHYVFIYTCDHDNNKRKNPKEGQFPYAKKPSGKYFKGLIKENKRQKNQLDIIQTG